MNAEDREKLGQHVREVWVAWARQQPNPKPSWLKPWAELSEPDKEVDRLIGESLFAIGEAQKQLAGNASGQGELVSFSVALAAVRAGKRVSHKLWDEGSMWIQLNSRYACIELRRPEGCWEWRPSQQGMLEDVWKVLD